MQFNAALGRDRDVAITFHEIIASAAGGTAADLEAPIYFNPDLTLSYTPSGATGSGVSTVQPGSLRGALAMNQVQLRQVGVLPQAAVTAGATNTYDWRIHVYRAGVLQGAVAFFTASVATTITPAVTAGSVQTVAVASTAGMRAGQTLYVDTGANLEAVTLLAVNTTGVTITAYFAKAHAGGVAIASNLIAFRQVNFVPAHGGVAVGATVPAITAGANQVVTPNTVNGLSGMYGIHLGDTITVTDAGLTETVTVSAVTTTTFTATFANSHAGGKVISTATLANQSASAVFSIQGGDAITLARISNNATGIPTPQIMLLGDLSTSASPMGR